MKVTCIGTDPAALYLGILLKRRDSPHTVRFVETGDADPSYLPVSIVCNPLKPRFDLEDAVTRDDLMHALTSFDKVTVSTEDKTLSIGDLRYAAIDPTAVADILRTRALALGCEFVRRSVTDEDRRSDVLIAADGANSTLRNSTPGFKPTLSRSTNRFVAFTSSEQRGALSYAFRITPHGIFHALALPRGRNGSCVIVETPAEVHHRLLPKALFRRARSYHRDRRGDGLANVHHRTQPALARGPDRPPWPGSLYVAFFPRSRFAFEPGRRRGARARAVLSDEPD